MFIHVRMYKHIMEPSYTSVPANERKEKRIKICLAGVTLVLIFMQVFSFFFFFFFFPSMIF